MSVMSEIVATLAKQDLLGGAKAYTKKQWIALGQEMGADSDFTLLIEESPLCSALNFYETSDAYDRCWEALDNACKPHGYHWEMGHHYTLHFYREDVS